MMSGTSMDGIDVSLIETNGIELNRLNKNFYLKYKKATKKLLSKIESNTKISCELKNELDKMITIEHINALNKSNFVNDADIIGFHGQTLVHVPKKKSIQICNPKLIAKTFKKKIVSNFRKNDIINNGQGAPLAPIYHKKIIEQLSMQLPACIINIGGISNITYWDGKNLLGFDTGPGNCLLDNIMSHYTRKEFDKDGEISKDGKVNKKIVNFILNDEYFDTKPPKSLDKLYFSEYLELIRSEKNALCDKLATLSYLTVLSIKKSFAFMPNKINSFCVTGGGYKNKFLMTLLFDEINAKYYDLNRLNITSDFIEAEMIAFLAMRKLNNLPSTFPTTTGVIKPTVCGEIFKI